MSQVLVYTCTGTGGTTTAGLLGIGAAGVPTCNPASAGKWQYIETEPQQIIGAPDYEVARWIAGSILSLWVLGFMIGYIVGMIRRTRI